MLHQRLFERLRGQSKNLRSGQYIEALGVDMKLYLQTGAPSKTGNLVRNLGTSTGIHERQQGFWVGYGKRQNVGFSNLGAPRGTIAAFLKDYPEFRRNWSYVMSVGSFWKALPIEGRRKLQEERLNGNYGGADQGIGVGKSAYLYPQEGSFQEWNASASKAGIKPTKFIAWAVDEWRARSLPVVMYRFQKDMGLKRA